MNYINALYFPGDERAVGVPIDELLQQMAQQNELYQRDARDLAIDATTARVEQDVHQPENREELPENDRTHPRHNPNDHEEGREKRKFKSFSISGIQEEGDGKCDNKSAEKKQQYHQASRTLKKTCSKRCRFWMKAALRTDSVGPTWWRWEGLRTASAPPAARCRSAAGSAPRS